MIIGPPPKFHGTRDILRQTVLVQQWVDAALITPPSKWANTASAYRAL